MATEAEGIGEELDDIDAMMAAAIAEGDSDAVKDFQDQQAKAKEALEKLKDQMDQAADSIDEKLAEKAPQVKEITKEATKDA